MSDEFPNRAAGTLAADPSPDAARRRVVDAFRRRHGKEPRIVVRAPGRVALLGAHIDYSEGWVMPAAIERAVWLAAAPTTAPRWTLGAVDLPTADGQASEAVLDLDALPTPPAESGRDCTWSDYPAGVAWALDEAGRRVSGLDAVYGGDLPRGGGVSSSAAVEVAFLLAAQELAALDPGAHSGRLDRRALARLARRVENGYLGLQSGIMDPYGSLFGRRDHLVLLDCRSETHELVPLPAGLAVWVVESGVERRLAGSGFNDRRGQCAAAVEALRAYLDHPVQSLRDVDPETLERHAHRLPMELRRRAQHAVYEMQRVRRAAEWLQEGDVVRFGRAMNASHRSSRDLYEVTVPELDVLCAAAWGARGCLGAKLMGGGFGGCVAILARNETLGSVQEIVKSAFEAEFGRRPEGFVTALADGAETWHFES